MKQFFTLLLLLLFSCAPEKSEVDTSIVEEKSEVQTTSQNSDDLTNFVKRVELQWNAILVSDSRQSAEGTMKSWVQKHKPINVDSFHLVCAREETNLKLYTKDSLVVVKLKKSSYKRGLFKTMNKPLTQHNLLEEDPYGKGKPIIYLYPEVTTEVSVELQFDGKLTYTYPTYPKEGWRVTAHPDGCLVDAEGKEYYSLFWEGYSSESGELPSGFVVHRDSVNSFLDEKLTILGLNYRERQEFIVFWAPVLMKSEYSMVHFATDEYAKRVPLVVSPKPDTQIRVMMYFKKSRLGEELKGQELVPVTRRGFTVVEWGGCNLDKPVRHYN